jgi:hypothetical protein
MDRLPASAREHYESPPWYMPTCMMVVGSRKKVCERILGVATLPSR